MYVCINVCVSVYVFEYMQQMNRPHIQAHMHILTCTGKVLT